MMKIKNFKIKYFGGSLNINKYKKIKTILNFYFNLILILKVFLLI